MLLSHVFCSKTVENLCEQDRSHLMLPQARHVGALIVPMGQQVFLKHFSSKYACLREIPDRLSYLKINKPIEDMFFLIVLFKDPVQKQCNWHFLLLKPIPGGSEVKILYVRHIYLGPSVPEYTIPH
jgi:hypothetical protein